MPQTRRPLTDYVPIYLDLHHKVVVDLGVKAFEPDAPSAVGKLVAFWQQHPEIAATGPNGYRGFWLCLLAKKSLAESRTPYDVARLFDEWAGPGCYREVNRLLGPPRRRGRPRKVPLPTPVSLGDITYRVRHRGRRGRRLEVPIAVRAFTIDALCELSGLPLRQAIGVWNRRFSRWAYGGDPANVERRFRLDRERVRGDLG